MTQATQQDMVVSDGTLRMMLRKIGEPSQALAVSFRTDDLHAILTELLRLRTATPAPEWQGMESAPKDGTEILLWCGQWVCGRGSNDTLDPERSEAGWTFDVHWPGMIEPTAWQPLPVAPTKDTAK